MNKMNYVSLVIVALIAGAVGALATGGTHTSSETTTSHERTYDRVMRTGELRCGYSVWDPFFFIDPKTNEKMGIFHDEMEEVGKRLGIKVVWQEELGWGSIIEAVTTNRVDAACSGYWLNPGRIKNLTATVSQLYSPLYVWVRADDTRSFNNLEDLNSDQYTAANIDGSADRDIIVRRFPKAKIFGLPELDSNSDLIEALVSGKADFIVVDAGTVAPYLANNPGKLKNAFPDHPLNVFPNVVLLPPNDTRLKEVIDNTMRHVEYDGTLDDILKKYHVEQSLLRNPMPVNSPPR